MTRSRPTRQSTTRPVGPPAADRAPPSAPAAPTRRRRPASQRPGIALIVLLLITSTLFPAQGDPLQRPSVTAPARGKGSPAAGQPLRLLPADLAQGGEVLAAIGGQSPGVDLDVRLRLPGGALETLTTVTTDRFGNALARAPLPDVPAGDYLVELVGLRTVLGSATLRVSGAPVVLLDPIEGVGGERVEVLVTGLPPGRVAVLLGDTPVIGPEVPEDGALTGRFLVPEGGMTVLPVRVEARVGDRLTGTAETTFQRLRTEQDAVQVLSSSFPPGPYQRHTLQEVTGQVALPDRLAPEHLRWTLALELRGGRRVPVNGSAIRFTPIGNKGRSRVYDFSADMIVPSVLSGFDFIESSGEVGVEFVAQTPDTGATGAALDPGGLLSQSQAVLSAPAPAFLEPIDTPVFAIDDQFGIAIEGRVVDGADNGLAGVQVIVRADTAFIPPFQVGLDPADIFDAKAPGDQVPVARAAALANEVNQVAAAAVQLGVVTDGGHSCGANFRRLETDGDGRFSFAFSPEYTNFLNLMAAGKASADQLIFQKGPSGSASSYEDRFTVEINGLLREPPYGQPSSLYLNSYKGVAYTFERDPESGLYFFCEPGTEVCKDFFDPTQTLVTTLLPAPDVPRELSAALAIEGLAAPSLQQQVRVWEGLITFPGQTGNPSLESATALFRMDWDEISFGLPTATLTLDGIGTFPLAKIAAQTCIDGHAVYGAQIPALATRAGDITGELNVDSPSGDFFAPVRIETFPGPTWFQDASRYRQPVALDWSPALVEITAEEVEKDLDVSRNVGAVGIGQLDNRNVVDGVVTQTFTGNATNEQQRASSAQVTVMNDTGTAKMRPLPLQAGRNTFSDEVLLDFGGKGQSARDELAAREGEPTFGMKDEQVLLGAFIPLARYVWGVPPIAAATFGVDLLYLVQLLNYGYVEITWNDIVDVDSITEPSSIVSLLIFFDFSAIFGLVSAKVSVDPAIGIGMPLIITDSALNTAESLPCFQFDLPITFTVSVGPCPLCISGSYSAVPVDFEEPDDCQIGLGKQQPKGLAAAANPDGLALAGNGAGSAMAMLVDETGIRAQRILAGLPDTFYDLTSGRGAIKPDIAYYRQDAAVAVWSQSALSETEYDQRVAADYDCTRADVEADPACDDQERFDAYKEQRMVYATFDGTFWSLPTVLTAPNTGEGGVRLAACPQSDTNCPPGGEVLAVWHRTLGNLEDQEIRLVHSFFDGVAWSPPAILDGSPGAHVQPAPAYLDGEPVVIWVYNPTPLAPDGGLRLETRELVYRFLRQSAGTLAPPGFPPSVASPDLEGRAGTLYLAYTANAPGDPFIGSRRALHTATATNCSAGVCAAWSTDRQHDPFGRNIFVEQPRLELNGADQPVVTYRWLGTGGSYVPDDPFGVFGTGETAMSVVTPGQAQTEVIPLTDDGQVNWQTQVIYDAGISSFLAVSAQIETLGQKDRRAKLGATRRGLGSVQRRKLAGGRPVTLFEIPDLPDLTFRDARVLGPTIVGGDDVIALEATIANVGLPLADGTTTAIEAWWDGPPGVGTLVGGAGGITLSDPRGTSVLLEADVPAGVRADELHRLELIVNPGAAFEESNGANNAYYIPFNRLPVPGNVRGFTDLGGTTAFLAWDDPEDPRIGSYRIYRRARGSTEVIQAGVSPRLGFADVMSVPEQTYEYCVAALSARLLESDCSPWVRVAVRPLRGPVVFGSGFE